MQQEATQGGLVCKPSTSIPCRQVALKMNSNGRTGRAGRSAQRWWHQPSQPIIAEPSERSISTHTGLLQTWQPRRSQGCLFHNMSRSQLWCGNHLYGCQIPFYTHRYINIFSNFLSWIQECLLQAFWRRTERSLEDELISSIMSRINVTLFSLESHPEYMTWNSTYTPKAYWEQLHCSQNPWSATVENSISEPEWNHLTGHWLKKKLNWVIRGLSVWS